MRSNTLKPKVRSRFLFLLFLTLAACPLCADQIEMQNGERYLGKVLLLTNDVLIVQSEVLGTVRLPRSKVAAITLGQAATNVTRSTAVTLQRPSITGHATNGTADISTALRQLGAKTNFIQQVQEQLLSSAGPEANAKYNEMVSGLMSGQLNLGDIRAQASSAANQLRTLKRDMGDDAGWAVDGYLTILDSFLRETASQGKASTNSLPAAARKLLPDKDDE